jgi:restriction system protein
LEKARQRREELAALLASVKYQLIHTDWRALRGVDFEQFLSHVFEMLGYHVQLTKASGDQGADLLVTGKGARIAVQAKGYADSVGNGAVQEVGAAMAIYQCTSCAVITNSRFTRLARQLAQANGCRLIDGAQIPGLIEGRIYN